MLQPNTCFKNDLKHNLQISLRGTTALSVAIKEPPHAVTKSMILHTVVSLMALEDMKC